MRTLGRASAVCGSRDPGGAPALPWQAPREPQLQSLDCGSHGTPLGSLTAGERFTGAPNSASFALVAVVVPA